MQGTQSMQGKDAMCRAIRSCKAVRPCRARRASRTARSCSAIRLCRAYRICRARRACKAVRPSRAVRSRKTGRPCKGNSVVYDAYMARAVRPRYAAAAINTMQQTGGFCNGAEELQRVSWRLVGTQEKEIGFGRSNSDEQWTMSSELGAVTLNCWL
jgi:hypothetical protein